MRVNKIVLIKQIKEVIHEFVYHPPKFNKAIFSVHLSKKLKAVYDYSYMAQQFSKTEGKTIEKYLMFIKIKRVKELILADEMTLTEIAKKQGYSSLPHLCSQFRKVTGKTLSQFRNKTIK